MTVDRRAPHNWTLADWLGFSFPILTTVLVFAVASMIFEPPAGKAFDRSPRWLPGASSTQEHDSPSSRDGTDHDDSSPLEEEARSVRTLAEPRAVPQRDGAEGEQEDLAEREAFSMDREPRLSEPAARVAAEALNRVHVMAPFGIGEAAREPPVDDGRSAGTPDPMQAQQLPREQLEVPPPEDASDAQMTPTEEPDEAPPGAPAPEPESPDDSAWGAAGASPLAHR